MVFLASLIARCSQLEPIADHILYRHCTSLSLRSNNKLTIISICPQNICFILNYIKHILVWFVHERVSMIYYKIQWDFTIKTIRHINTNLLLICNKKFNYVLVEIYDRYDY